MIETRSSQLRALGSLPNLLEECSFSKRKILSIPPRITLARILEYRGRSYKDPKLQKLSRLIFGKEKITPPKGHKLGDLLLSENAQQYLVEYFFLGKKLEEIGANRGLKTPKQTASSNIKRALRGIANYINCDEKTAHDLLLRLCKEHPLVDYILNRVDILLASSATRAIVIKKPVNNPDLRTKLSLEERIAVETCKRLNVPKSFFNNNQYIIAISETSPYGKGVSFYTLRHELLGHTLLDNTFLKPHSANIPTTNNVQRLAVNLNFPFTKKFLDRVAINTDNNGVRRFTLIVGSQSKATTLQLPKNTKEFTHVELYLCPVGIVRNVTIKNLLVYGISANQEKHQRELIGLITMDEPDKDGIFKHKWRPIKKPEEKMSLLG